MTNTFKRVTVTISRAPRTAIDHFFTSIKGGNQQTIRDEVKMINTQILEQLVQAYSLGMRSAFPDRASDNLWRLKNNLDLPHLISDIIKIGKTKPVIYINSLHFVLEDIDKNYRDSLNEVQIYLDRYNKHVTEIDAGEDMMNVSLAMGAYRARKNTWTSNLEYTIQSKLDLDVQAMYTLLVDLEKTKIWDVVHNYKTMNFSSKDDFVFEFTTTQDCDIEELFRLLSNEVTYEMSVKYHKIIPEPEVFTAGGGRITKPHYAQKLVK